MSLFQVVKGFLLLESSWFHKLNLGVHLLFFAEQLLFLFYKAVLDIIHFRVFSLNWSFVNINCVNNCRMDMVWVFLWLFQDLFYWGECVKTLCTVILRNNHLWLELGQVLVLTFQLCRNFLSKIYICKFCQLQFNLVATFKFLLLWQVAEVGVMLLQ